MENNCSNITREKSYSLTVYFLHFGYLPFVFPALKISLIWSYPCVCVYWTYVYPCVCVFVHLFVMLEETMPGGSPQQAPAGRGRPKTRRMNGATRNSAAGKPNHIPNNSNTIHPAHRWGRQNMFLHVWGRVIQFVVAPAAERCYHIFRNKERVNVSAGLELSNDVLSPNQRGHIPEWAMLCIWSN